MLARIRKSLDQKEEGFTLIELLVVIIIIGILAAIAIPVFLSQRGKGYDAQSKSDLRNLATAEESYLTDQNVYIACAGAGLCTTQFTTTSNQGLKLSQGDKVMVQLDSVNAAAGYCASAQSKSGSYFYYDSENGGLVPQTFPTLAALQTAVTAQGTTATGTGACRGLTITQPATT